MKKVVGIFVFIICLIAFSAQAQKYFTISRYLKDANTGEALISAAIIIKELAATGTNPNAHGFYSITITEGK